LTNYFSQGDSVTGSSATIDEKSSFDVSDWHTYGINWQPDALEWSIDGKVVKTIKSSAVGVKYPNSPSRVQISTWAGGNITNAAGVIAWAGGEIDWTSANYTSQGYYSAEIKSFAVTCASQTVSDVSTTGNGTSVTSWVYTGSESTTYDAPEFSLSTTPISYLATPSLDGTAGLPGYSVQSEFSETNKNAWDGSGDTSGLSTKATTKSSSAKSSSSSTSSAGTTKSTGGSSEDSTTSTSTSSSGTKYWLDNNQVLSIAVPVAGAAVGLLAIWCLVSCCLKRRNRANERDSNKDYGGISNFNVGSLSGARTTARQTSLYKQLKDEEEDTATPLGAQKIGSGYGRAAGPRPGQSESNIRGYTDSTTSLHDTREYQSSSDGAANRHGYGALAAAGRGPAPNQANIRGPYQPASNAYTPAMRQTTQTGASTNYASRQQHQQQQGGGYGNYATPDYQPRSAYPSSQQTAARPLYNTNANAQAYPHQPSTYPQQQNYNSQSPSRGY
jgi:beta-glucanase (GH16 family)